MGASCLSSRIALISITGRHGPPTRLISPSKCRLRQTRNPLQTALSMTRKTYSGITSVSSIMQRPCTKCGHRTVSSSWCPCPPLAPSSHHVVSIALRLRLLDSTVPLKLPFGTFLSCLLSSKYTDPNFRKKAPKFTGIRIMSQDAWEALVGFICSSNNNISRISQMVWEHHSSRTIARCC